MGMSNDRVRKVRALAVAGLMSAAGMAMFAQPVHAQSDPSDPSDPAATTTTTAATPAPDAGSVGGTGFALTGGDSELLLL
ncbi:MAG: hypothetical protein ABIY48_08370, partial [Acidimicrobiales bacterium]